MEPHTMDPAHELLAPRQEGVFGPQLWIDVPGRRVWQEGSAGDGVGEPGANSSARLVWVGRLVVVVAMGPQQEQLPGIAGALRAFFRQEQLPIVFSRAWLPEKIGTVIAADAAGASALDLARAEAYALVQARWFEEERITVELTGEVFQFEVRSVLDAADRVQVTIR
jgi:hypothetical protein